MRFQTLSDWLHWQEQLHPKSMELELERVRAVWQRLQDNAFACPVIIVGGTNGKGSCVAMLESIYREAGYRVGSYTSPHIWRYNERIRIDGEPVTDADLCEAFEQVDRAREQTSLTYFEFGTLAALAIFQQHALDVIILEVGLGGRLDAVNIIDADVAIITSIDLDHTQWLGNDRAAIAREKAGILRANHIGIVADPVPPATLVDYATSIQSRLLCLGRDFDFHADGPGWSWHAGEQHRVGLPIPALSGVHQLRNAAAAIMAIDSLQTRLPVSQAHLRSGLLSVRLSGRFQLMSGSIRQVFDVAHNPAAASQLAATLRQAQFGGAVHAVFSALADKDIAGLVVPLCELVRHWHIAPLQDVGRGADLASMTGALSKSCVAASVSTYTDVQQAYTQAVDEACPGDTVLVYGSFYTVAQTCPHGL
ncbi:MAG: bifunctional tetrahydrofolate synthase/dihydrofolate synthase [Gammaproteobacteria bacterium]|jgi:dihydrofolate synthase / folylpolyglutamate synthase